MEAKTGSFRLAFNVPHRDQRDANLEDDEVLTAEVTLTKTEARILESIDYWHYKDAWNQPVTPACC